MVKRKMPDISSEHKAALAKLSVTKEFAALEQLIRIEKNNIMVLSFGVPSTDPLLAIHKAKYEGRLYELDKILQTFAAVRKGKEE